MISLYPWSKDPDSDPRKDYEKCPKCGRTMELLFNVRICPDCDGRGKKEKEVPPLVVEGGRVRWV